MHWLGDFNDVLEANLLRSHILQRKAKWFHVLKDSSKVLGYKPQGGTLNGLGRTS